MFRCYTYLWYLHVSVTPDKESDDGFDDLCDLVLDTDESVEEEAEIHIPMEDIGDFPSGVGYSHFDSKASIF